MPPSIAILVLGLPRSGTSITARLLGGLGVYMGERLPPPPPPPPPLAASSVMAPGGSCEDADFNDALAFPPDPALLYNLVSRRCREYSHWGFKSFHVLSSWSTFLAVLPKETDLRLVICRRLFYRCVDSYCARSGDTLEQRIPIAGRMLYDLERIEDMFTGPKLWLRYDMLVEQPLESISRLNCFCGTTNSLEARSKLCGLVKPEYRRF